MAGSVEGGRNTKTAIELRDESRKKPERVCDDKYVRQDEARQVQAELQRARATLEQARRAVSDLDDQARRAGVPPGWVR